LVHFAGRDGLNIEGLSEQTLEKLVERGFVSDYTDLFTLHLHEQEIMQMEGFGQKSTDNLLAAVEKAKDTALPHFIYALGIKHVGLANAKLLCVQYKYDMERIIEAARSDAYMDELSAIKGFGEAIAVSLHQYFTHDENLALLRRAMGFVRFSQPEVADEMPKPLDGLTFVITGDVARFENRKAMQSFIEGRGGKVTGSVTGKTSYLINNDTASTSGKNKKAAQLGVPVLSENEFLEKFELAGV
jgi:DNA ligase (NAD+)